MRATPAVALLLSLASAAHAGDFEDECEAARETVVPALVELATWCGESKLYATRNELAADILRRDPENTQAKRWLKYRVRGGKWTPPVKPPVSRDLDPAALARLPEERARRLLPGSEALHAALLAHADSVTPEQRETTLLEILALTPDVAEFRIAHDEVQRGDGWELVETAAGRARRKVLRNAAKRAVADVPAPRSDPVLLRQMADAFRWKGTFETADVLAASTVNAGEARNVAIDSQAVPDYLEGVFGIRTSVGTGLTYYLLAGHQEATRLLDAHPNTSEENRKHYKSFGSAWVGDTSEYAIYQLTATLRREAAVRAAIARAIRDALAMNRSAPSAVREGVEIRLAYELFPSRALVTRKISRYDDSASPWADPGEIDRLGWYGAAQKLLEIGGPAELSLALGKSLNELTREDYRIANAFAAYYVEGRPTECVELLRALGTGTALVDAIQKISHLDLAALRLRMIRWLRERDGDD